MTTSGVGAWTRERFRYLFSERTEKGFPNEELLAATQHAGVVPKASLEFKTMEPVTSDLSIFKLVRPGDFVISLRSFEGGLEYSSVQGILSPAYTVLQPSSKVHPRFFKHLLKSSDFIQGLERHKKGIRDGQAVPFSTLRDDYLTVPSFAVQERIANFLDEQTARIDALIAEKEVLSQRLEEYWLSCLSHSMQLPDCAGGRPLPSGWRAIALKRLCSAILTGRTPAGSRNDCFTDEGTPWVTPGDFAGLRVSTSTRQVTDIAIHDAEVRVYPAGSTLLVGIGATVGNVGHAVVPLSANQQINVLIPDTTCVDPLFLTLSVLAAREQIRLAAGAATLPIINQEKTGRIRVAVPALAEQEAIRDRLLLVREQTDSMQQHVHEHIARLREYRSSLISAAITGQLDLSAFREAA